MDKLEFCLRRY
uniref:Uncharacterized protein n=1 Tax=Arundo donax TaxID=35708 RepID=A0A0A8ZRM5_ARUDO